MIINYIPMVVKLIFLINYVEFFHVGNLEEMETFLMSECSGKFKNETKSISNEK